MAAKRERDQEELEPETAQSPLPGEKRKRNTTWEDLVDEEIKNPPPQKAWVGNDGHAQTRRKLRLALHKLRKQEIEEGKEKPSKRSVSLDMFNGPLDEDGVQRHILIAYAAEQHSTDGPWNDYNGSYDNYGFAYPILAAVDEKGNQHFFYGSPYMRGRHMALQNLRGPPPNETCFSRDYPTQAFERTWSNEAAVPKCVWKAIVREEKTNMKMLDMTCSILTNSISGSDADTKIYSLLDIFKGASTDAASLAKFFAGGRM